MKKRWKTEVGASLSKRLLFFGHYYDYEICRFKGKMSASKRLIDSKAWCLLSVFTWNTITKMGIQNKDIKNSTKSKNYTKSKTLSEIEKLDIDWLVYIVIKPSVPCSARKSTSEKMSVNSIQNWPPQLTLKLVLVRVEHVAGELKRGIRHDVRHHCATAF